MLIKCPLCKKEAAWEDNPFRPFCSERCRMADLARWASEEYAIPAENGTVPDADAEEK